MVATKVGTSVCPAEYSVARPYSASAPTESSRPLSSWRARDSTVRLGTWGGLRQRGTHIGQLQLHRRFGQGDGHLERLGRGIVRHGDFQRGRALLVDTEVVGDRARDERRDVGTLAGEFHDRADDDLGLVGGRESDEPPVIGTVGILRSAGFAGDGNTAEAGAARGSLLDDGGHGGGG